MIKVVVTLSILVTLFLSSCDNSSAKNSNPVSVANQVEVIINNGSSVWFKMLNLYKLGDIRAIKNIISQNDSNDFENVTLFEIACSDRESGENWSKFNILLVKYLIKGGINVNNLTGGGIGTPLYIAIKDEKYEIADLLLKNGADINLAWHNSVRKQKPSTPLLSITSYGNEKQVKYLLENGANPNLIAIENGMTPIEVAAEVGNVNIVRMLINSGANIFFQNSRSLKIAANNNHSGIVKLLKENGAKGNVSLGSNEEQLLAAIESENLLLVEKILKSNVKINTPIKGHTFLVVAIHTRNADLVRILLENGANVNMFAKGEQPPIWASTVYGNSLDIIKQLLRKGVKPVKHLGLELNKGLAENADPMTRRYIEKNYPELLGIRKPYETKEKSYQVGSRISVIYQNGAYCKAIIVTPGAQDSKVEFTEWCETGFANSVSDGEKKWVPNTAITTR